MTEPIRVEFPQYAARWEQTGEPPNVMVIARCPICNKVVTQRSWVGFEPPKPDAEILILVGADERKVIASDAELQAVVDARLKDSAQDRETYWAHLRTAHPERFQD